MEVSQQSWGSRVCGSVIGAICVAPLLLLGATLVLGFNEQRAVCSAKAIIQGKEKVVEVGCDPNPGPDGALIKFSCPIDKAVLPTLNFDGDFLVNFVGTGLEVKSEMYQCVEKSSSSTRKTSGGGTETVTTYSYYLDWRSNRVDSESFNSRTLMRDQCGIWSNPSWPAGVPRSNRKYAERVKVGSLWIPQSLIASIPLSVTIPAKNVTANWTMTGAQTYEKAGSYPNGVGAMRVKFTGNDWNSPTMTVLGEKRQDSVASWMAASSWLCSGFTLLDLRPGTVSKETLFAQLQAEANFVTWFLRILGFLMCWVAFCLCFGPLEVMADVIPCIGPCLGDSIAAITSCLACIPGCACALGVIGVVWVAMRPLVGIPLMLLFLCMMGGSIAFGLQQKQKRDQQRQVLVMQQGPSVEMRTGV